MITHGNIIANTEAIIESLRLTSDDSIMAVLPFHYCFGASLLHTHLRAGASIVVDSRFTYPEVVLDRMSETGCTGFAGVPMHFQILLRRSSLARRRLPRLRYVQQAGGRLAPPFVVELRRALPAVQVFLMYGQTEATARLSYLPPEFVDTKPGSIGRGMKDVHLRVLTEDGVDVQPGQIGEIVATGRSIAQGYWQERESTATPFRNGALNTGDLATVDDDGFIYIVDRRSDFVKCRGERVSCRSVEDILIASDELAEAAVVGVDDPVLGEALKAFVVPRSDRSRDGTVERLKAFCRTRLPLHLVPQEFVVLDALPKYDTGKIAKSRLKLEHTTATTVEADMNELS
jgi:acyl-CoA synthetase (AMP-forming)/AMP-acid ligase II